MKYNPKLGEKIATMPEFTQLHPLLPQLRGGGMLTQGALQVLYETAEYLKEIVGLSAFTLQPMAGAHGELTGIMLIAAYHRHNNNKKTRVIVPDSAHGTNPSSAAIAGYEVVSVPTGKDGCMDYNRFVEILDDRTAAVMLTCPNTLGLFNPRIKEIADKTHQAGGLMYYDGANLNAILGKVRPGDVGFDVVHLNLHKTFGTPHGGGGPGAGPVGVASPLTDFLPIPRVVRRDDGTYGLDFDCPLSIGQMASFYGNFGVILKAFAYILTLGKSGLIEVAEKAVLNANYLMQKLKKYYSLPYDRTCMHEFVLSAEKQTAFNIHALDIAKALIDYGIHPPTIYFPLIVKEALMIEPTETEAKEVLDIFIQAMIEIAQQAETEPEKLKQAPTKTAVSRLDETLAARQMKLTAEENNDR